MREIKFRVWNNTSMETFVLDNEFDCISGWVGEYPLMQYTGLKDIYEIEIYEGDIVEDEYGCNHKIEWDTDFAAFSCGKITLFDEKLYNIIGNIHENPELINN